MFTCVADVPHVCMCVVCVCYMRIEFEVESHEEAKFPDIDVAQGANKAMQIGCHSRASNE